MISEAQKLREQADKFWHDVVGRIKWSSPFAKQGIVKVQAMYNKADELEHKS